MALTAQIGKSETELAGCWAATAQHSPNNQRKSIVRDPENMVRGVVVKQVSCSDERDSFLEQAGLPCRIPSLRSIPIDSLVATQLLSQTGPPCTGDARVIMECRMKPILRRDSRHCTAITGRPQQISRRGSFTSPNLITRHRAVKARKRAQDVGRCCGHVTTE